MARKKVNLQWITNTSTRRTTYKRRCNGMKKKVDELATLCGAKVGVVLYGEEQAKPLAWPNESVAKEIFQKFNNMPDFNKKFKKTQNQEELLSNRILKLQHQVNRLEHENYKREILFLLYESMDGRRPGLIGSTDKERTSLLEMVEEKTKKAEERIRQLQLAMSQEKGAAPEPPLTLQLGSSSAHPLASYTFNEIQNSMVPAAGREPPPQQDWTANLSTNGGGLGTIVPPAFVGSNGGIHMTQNHNMDYFSTFP